jgi:2-phospho-L-lactate guanylyltransferase (CobY/MobA/RfbA family)
MATVVVPYRREAAKQRLAPAPDEVRAALAQAMFEDVIAAARAVGEVVVADEGGGQGAAVEGALRRVEEGPILVVNADLPCARPRDLLTLLGGLPAGGLALVAAADGTTNALALSASHLFAPLYGPGSAERFLARAERLKVPAALARIPNLADDVDTLADLERLDGRLGARTAATLRVLGSRTGAAEMLRTLSVLR